VCDAHPRPNHGETTVAKPTINPLLDGYVDIPGDGHCLFAAFAYGWARTQGCFHRAALSVALSHEVKMYMREEAVRRVCRDRELRALKVATFNSSLEAYRHKMTHDATCWGDDIEMVALMRRFHTNVALIDISNRQRPWTTVRTYDPAARTVNMQSLIYLIYDGVHYSAFDPDFAPAASASASETRT